MIDIFLLCVIIMNLALVATLLRLKVKHDGVFNGLSLDRSFPGSPRQLAIILEFILKRRYDALKDPFLAWAGAVFAASFLGAAVLMVANLLGG